MNVLSSKEDYQVSSKTFVNAYGKHINMCNAWVIRILNNKNGTKDISMFNYDCSPNPIYEYKQTEINDFIRIFGGIILLGHLTKI